MLFNKLVGGATAATIRVQVFDEEWTEVYHELLKLTQRSDVLMAILGTLVPQDRVMEAGNRYLKEIGIKPSRPRGKNKSPDSKAFLVSCEDRRDATYLLNLYLGWQDSNSSEDFRYITRARRLIETYNRYVADLYPNCAREDVKLNFDTFFMIIDAMSRGQVRQSKCYDCGSVSPFSKVRPTQDGCPICEKLGLKPDEAREKLKARIAQRGSLILGDAEQRVGKLG